MGASCDRACSKAADGEKEAALEDAITVLDDGGVFGETNGDRNEADAHPIVSSAVDVDKNEDASVTADSHTNQDKEEDVKEKLQLSQEQANCDEANVAKIGASKESSQNEGAVDANREQDVDIAPKLKHVEEIVETDEAEKVTEADKVAEEEAQKKAKEEAAAAKKAAEAKRKAAAAKKAKELDAKKKAEAAKKQAEEEARRKTAEEESKRKAEVEAKKKAEEEALAQKAKEEKEAAERKAKEEAARTGFKTREEAFAAIDGMLLEIGKIKGGFKDLQKELKGINPTRNIDHFAPLMTKAKNRVWPAIAPIVEKYGFQQDKWQRVVLDGSMLEFVAQDKKAKVKFMKLVGALPLTDNLLEDVDRNLKLYE